MYTRETILLLVVLYGVEDIANIANAAFREFAVIRSIAASCRGEHYVVAVQSTRTAFRRKVVLKKNHWELD